MSLVVCGLDLGQSNDYSAFCAIEATPTPYEIESVELEPEFKLPMDREYVVEGPPIALALRGLERLPLGTPYPKVVEHVIGRLGALPGERVLAIDATGVGRPVADMFSERSVPFVGISIHGGAGVTRSEAGYLNVPKRDLIHGLLVAFQQKRLTLPDAAALPAVDELVRELQTVEIRISKAGHDSYEAWREGSHDDLVLAVAVACWTAEHELGARYAVALAEIEARRWEDDAEVRIGPPY